MHLLRGPDLSSPISSNIPPLHLPGPGGSGFASWRGWEIAAASLGGASPPPAEPSRLRSLQKKPPSPCF